MPFVNPKKGAYPTSEKDIAPQAQQPVQAAMAAVVQETVSQIEELDEVERRAIKADAYRKVIHMEIFDNDQEPEFYEVEKEIQTFARERMRVFLGMDPDNRLPTQVAAIPVQVELPFTEQQVEVLGRWADGLIQRPQLLGAVTAPPRGRQVESTTSVAQPPVQSQTVTTQPASAPVQAPAKPANADPNKRGRGRPPGTGKNQRAAAVTKSEPAPAQTAAPSPTDEMRAKLAEDYPGVEVQVDPSTGRPYLMVERIVDGKTAFVRVDAADQTKPLGVQPRPWPTGHSPLENEGPSPRMIIAGDTTPQLNRELNEVIKQFR